LDEGSLSNILGFVLLIAVNAVLTLAYAALVNTRPNQLRELSEEGDTRAGLALHLTQGPTRLHITYQLCVNLVRFFVAAWAAINLAQPLVAATPTLPPILDYGLVMFFTAMLTLIFGEIVPEAIGSSYSHSLALWAARPMSWLVILLRPLVAFMLWVSRAMSAPFGSSRKVDTITEEEIMSVVDAGHSGGSIEEEEKDMIYSVLQLDQTVVREVMVPRIDVVALDIETPLQESLGTFIESGFSRIPIYEDTIDNIKGLLYAKDLLNYWHNGVDKPIRELIRTAYFVPENKRADDLLKEMQAQKVHLAMVVDEYGGTAGLVTIEDLIEEIIGDILDEYDVNEEAEYVQHGEYEYTFDASIDLDDFNDLMESELPTEDSDTLGGFIYTHLGRVPVIGEVIETHGLSMRVESIEGRRIRKVHVERKKEEPPASDTAGDLEPEPVKTED
jgi:CBS domain containing-hemolysin-like protein